MSQFVNVQNANRRNVYQDVIADIAEKKVCPFCPEHLEEFHKKPIDRRKFWIVTDNMYPYMPSRHHKLFIASSHIEHISDVSREAWDELYSIIQESVAANDMKGGTFIARFGETQFTGASVTHLHVNLVQSNPEDPSYDPQVGIVRRIG